MWKLFFIPALALAPLAAAHGGSPGTPVRASAAAGVECLVRAEPQPGGVQLEGVVASRAPLSGTYHFDVRKAGPGGVSNSAQSGEFEARAGEEVVGNVGLGLERGASYDAKLVLRWKGGEASCAAKGPDRAPRS